MRLKLINGVLLTCTFALVSCTGPDRPAWLSWKPNEWANRSSADEAIELDVIGPAAVDVESFNGDVRIEGVPDLTRARIILVREGIHGYGRQLHAAETLGDIAIDARVAPGALGQVLVIRTSTANAEPHLQRAHVHVQVPQLSGVRVRTSNGDVTAKYLQGPVDIETSFGEVRVMSNLAMRDPVTIVNHDGDINYRVRAESSGRFDAQTVNGSVKHIVRYGNLVVQPPTGDDRLIATLNDGTNPITLRTTNGTIRIAVVHNPEHVGDRIRG